MAAFGASAAALSLGDEADASPRSSIQRVQGSEGDNLEFYNWDTYLGETTLRDFRNTTGIAVNLTFYASNDYLLSNLSIAPDRYDLIIPGHEYLSRMIDADLLLPLDHAKIPNKNNLDPSYLNPTYDPGLRYSMPYTSLVIGIGYRKSALKSGIVPNSWRYLFDSNTYKGRISLASNAADLMRLCLKYMGIPLHTVTPALIARARDMLMKQKPNIKNFHFDDGQDLLMSKEVDLVMEYNGDIAQKMVDDDDLGFVVPKEGSLLSVDSMCIPKRARHPNNAHAMINFILDARHGAEIARTILYPTPNMAARVLLDKAYRSNSTLFPPPAQMALCEYGQYQGSEISQAYENAMTQLRVI
jgi:spermidine/putrescine transport system substrate-binding protein